MRSLNGVAVMAKPIRDRSDQKSDFQLLKEKIRNSQTATLRYPKEKTITLKQTPPWEKEDTKNG
jgi:hypothetical protein